MQTPSAHPDVAENLTAAATAEAPHSPIIIEMEPQAEEDVEDLVAGGKGVIYDSVHVTLDQMKVQGLISGPVQPVFIVLSSGAPLAR
jgi:hypothetical protein